MRRGGLSAIGAIWALNSQSVFAQSASLVTAPRGPMRLRRTLSRELVDGNMLVVARSWEVEFSSARHGWLVDGNQIGVEVDADPGLEALAELERSRATTESFPLELDHLGKIRFGTPKQRHVGIDQLAQAADSAVISMGGTEITKGRLRLFLTQMQQASLSLMTSFPQDLFFPSSGELSESKTMDLPGGLKGQMELTYRAQADPASGLLSSSKRSVITRIEGEELFSSEAWQLTPA